MLKKLLVILLEMISISLMKKQLMRGVVQEKFAFSCVLRSTPDGVIGADAGNDMYRLDRRISADLLRDYGKVLRLIAEIEECIAVWDAGPADRDSYALLDHVHWACGDCG